MKKNSIFRWGVAMLLLFTGLSLRAYAEDDGGSPFRKNHDVDLTVKSATLQTFTDAFTKQTGVLFSYESALASMPMGDVSVRESNAPLERILNNVFTKRGFRYKIVDRTVVLTYDRTAEPQRKNSVTGRVCDAAGSPLVGATVLVKDSTRGTTTGADGTYSVEAEPGAVLLFSYIGYTEREELVGSRSVIDVTMQEDQSVLEEVVVVGYGTQTRKTVTSAISKMDGKTLESMPVNLVGDGMKGRIAGLQVATTDATPGSAPKFLIRGGSSINNSNDPIVLVDGAVREMAGLNPNDIESIEVLKDAASAGIYGSRASNGVILITTKKGAPHKGPQIVFEGQWAYESPATKFDLMNGRDYLLTLRPAIAEGYCGGADPLSILDGAESAGAGNSAASRWTTRYLNPGESLPKGYKWIEDPVNPGKIIVFQDNDQQSQWFDDAFWQNYYIGVNGGGENIRYAASAGYTDDGGIGMATGFSRFTFHGNTSFKVTRRLTATTTFDYSQIERQMLDGGALNKRNSVIRGLSVPATHRDWYDAEAGEDLAGTPAMGPNNTTLPAAYYNYYYSDTGETTKRSSVNINLEWAIVDGLRAVAQFSNHNRHSRSHFFVKNNPTTGTNIRPTKEAFTETNRMDFQTYLNWKKTFAEDHNIDVVAGYDYMKDKNNSIDARVQGAASDKIPTLNVGTSNITNYPTSTRTDEVLISYFGRVNYNFREKYLLSFTMRADGSTKFGKNNKWGYFPSGAVSWKMHNEPWLKQSRWLSELKLRLSYGASGNQGISSYQTLDRYGMEKFWHNGEWATVIGPGYEVGRTGANNRYMVWGGIANPDLKWESTSQLDFGVDFAAFDRRLRLTADVYYKKTPDLLREKYLPLPSSYDKIWVNDGEVTNKGFEVSLEGDIVHTRDWSFSATFIYSMNRNKVVSLGDAISSGLSQDYLTGLYYEVTGEPISMFNQNASIYAVGHPMNVFYGYRVDGIIQEGQDPGFIDPDGLKDRPGELKYVDLTGDYAITPEDRCIIGDPNPDFTASLNLSLRWKNLDLSVFLYGVYGNDVLYNNYTFSPRVKAKRWTPDNPTNDFPRLNNARQYWLSDYFLQDGSFLRIQNITLGYNLHFNRRFLKGMRIYANIDNVHTFTKFDGYDPEVGLDGIYWGGYPKLRKYTVGIDLNF